MLRGMLPLNVRFGRAVSRLRKRADFSQERFANAIGVHRTTIGIIGRGLGNPCLHITTGIARGLGITVTRLFEAVENESG